MRIISYNVNGMRSYMQKDVNLSAIRSYNPNILCFQEIKCSAPLFNYGFVSLYPEGSFMATENTWKSGYAGVGTISDVSIEHNIGGLMLGYGEGRLVYSRLNEDTILINVYVLNSGNKDDLRREWNKKFDKFLSGLRSKGYKLIICGDLNVCGTEKDHWSGKCGRFNSFRNSGPGLMDYEREHFSEMLKSNNLVNLMDSIEDMTWFRYTDKAESHGWRLDYFLVDSSLVDKVNGVGVIKELRFSDHRPIYLDINL